jgi:hypothetical protein
MIFRGRQDPRRSMPASMASWHSRSGVAVQMLLLGLAAAMAAVTLSLGLEDVLADTILSKLESSLGQPAGQHDGMLMKALYLQNECSDELPECQKFEALADPTTLQCFTICISVEVGCRSCCSDATCYQLPGNRGSLGSCVPCDKDENTEQYAPAFPPVQSCP